MELNYTTEDLFGLQNYSITINGYESIKLIRSPFANCQVFTIARFDIILKRKPNEIKEILLLISSLIKKRLVVVDVQIRWKEKLLTLNPMFTTEYISTNASEMLLAMINIDTAINTIR